MNGSCILFFISAILACRAETENAQLKFLLEEMATLKKAVSTMEDVLKSQRDVIGDLRIQNQRQEIRIQYLETASKNRDEFIPGIKERIERRNLHSKRLIGVPPYEGIVAFYAQMTSVETSPGAHHTLIFDRIRTNVGLGYNNSTGVFTAPREGIYVFTWVIRMVTAEHSTELLINDDIFGATFLRAKNGDDGSVSGAVVAHVTRGDVVFVRTHSSYAGDGNIHSNVHGQPSFSGWLLH
uniref:C1q domain-containing protein n=1 Tax=Magallana gigas TaxID=29159 RepID=A0A8W8LJ65_MAGGI